MLTVLLACTPGHPVSDGAVVKSTLDDQSSVEVTVYNNQLALVKDTRSINLPKGNGELRFMDVAATIQPVTVHAKSVNAPKDFAILEQNYEYDLMNQNKLLEKYVGKDLEIILHNEYQDRKETVQATLLSNNQGQIYQIEDKIYLGHPGIKVLPMIPEDLIDKPTLAWLYANEASKPHEIELSYLASGIGWKADYIITLAENDDKMDLSGWVTLNNQSGTTYKDATLKLVAGDVNRVQQNIRRKGLVRAEAMMMADAGAPQFESQQFFEYHIYDLKRPTTIKNNQTKQVRFIEALGVKAEKEYELQAQGYYYGAWGRGQNPKINVAVYLKFKNEKDKGLGQPLPAGIMRLYKADHQKKLQFIGEDRISHTPKDEEVKLKLGNAFDVVAERKQINYKRITTKMHESEWEIKIRNHKDSDIIVHVYENISGNWTLTENSHEYEKEDAFKIHFAVNVPADSEEIVTYKVRVGI